MNFEPIKDEFGHVIINRDQCVYCADRDFCPKRIFAGRPSDCPRGSQNPIADTRYRFGVGRE
jgi:hypothetical protein